jgi:bifunctional DNase/RNase
MSIRALSVRGIRIDRAANTPVLSLREDEAPRRTLDIYIGAPEAAAISVALEGVTVPRPLTHDLFFRSIEALGASVERVVLTHVSDGTYFAEIVLSDAADEEVRVSARPSDAVALALRAGCPVYAQEELLESAGTPAREEEVRSEEILDEFRDFIENISPEDFDT